LLQKKYRYSGKTATDLQKPNWDNKKENKGRKFFSKGFSPFPMLPSQKIIE